MPFWVVHRVSDGTVDGGGSIGTVVADPLPDGWAKKEFPGDINDPRGPWNPANLDFDPPPAILSEHERIKAVLEDTREFPSMTNSEKRIVFVLAKLMRRIT